MSSGLYDGATGLSLGTSLYRNTTGLWSGSSGLVTGFAGSTLSPSLVLTFTSGTYSATITKPAGYTLVVG